MMRVIVLAMLLLLAAGSALRGYHAVLPSESVHDIAEVNHVYDLSGDYRFTQLLAWDWNRITDRYCCAGWKIVPRDKVRVTPSAHCTAVSAEGVTVYGRRYRETWYQWDVEVIDRDHWPESRRRGL